jgi:hypothetical protein
MSRLKVTVAIVGAVVCAVEIVDHIRYERACCRIITVSSELGGHAYSIGGWPLGREFVIRFDHPLTDDALRRFAATDPKFRRISLTAYFTCEVSEARLAAMREVVVPHRISIYVHAVGERKRESEPSE